MATFTANKPLLSEVTDLTPSILDLNAGPHFFAFVTSKQTLTIENNEVGALTINLLGDGQTSIECKGYGTIDVSLGKDIIVAAGDTVVINTAPISGYLGAKDNNVQVTITGSTGAALAFAWLSVWG